MQVRILSGGLTLQAFARVAQTVNAASLYLADSGFKSYAVH